MKNLLKRLLDENIKCSNCGHSTTRKNKLYCIGKAIYIENDSRQAKLCKYFYTDYKLKRRSKHE